MEKDEIRNLENVITHRRDICKAFGIAFTEDMITKDSFIGRFYSTERCALDAKGLINRGFCPLCGIEPIDNHFFRKAYPVTEYLCGDCWERTNPNKDPGYRKRRTIASGCMLIMGLGLMFLFFLTVKGCIGLIF